MAIHTGQQPASLPMPLTSLIGREREVAAASALLHRAEVRLLTLTGTGGVGKTRLALEVAGVVHADFIDGICFVPLAPVSDPARVMATIAQALGLWEVADLPPEEQVQAALRERHLLLVLDNFEHLLQAAPYLVPLLTSCPRLRILVTSRTILHLSGEHEFAVAPLALPDLTRLPEVQTLAQLPSVRLFVERAQALQPSLQLTEANARTLAEICVRLDGLPLAIELAAARIKLLPPQALLARLSKRLAVLTSGARNAPARLQTLRNTIEWSYHLLDAQEQQLFRRLSVFAGGCTLEAIEALCAALGDEAETVLDAVSSLIDKSLLQQAEQEEEPRLLMLETIREYGLEALVASGEMDVTRHAHATCYLVLAEKAELELDNPQQVMWLERLEQEHDNLRAALQFLLEQRETRLNREMALRLSAALRRFWEVRGHLSEGRSFLERALAGSEGVAVSVRTKALRATANLALTGGDHDQVEALCEESLALCRESDDKQGAANSLYVLGELAWRRSNYTAAHTLVEASLALWREVGERHGIAWSLTTLADVASDQGEYARGRALYEQSLALKRESSGTKEVLPGRSSGWHSCSLFPRVILRQYARYLRKASRFSRSWATRRVWPGHSLS